MAKLNVKNGATSVILRVKIMDSTSATGGAKTGLTETSPGLIIATIADNEATTTRYRASSSEVETIATLGTFAAPTGGKCRFKEVDATNHPGIYEVQLADARYAVSAAKSLIVTLSGASGMAQVDAEVQLSPVPANVQQLLDTAWLTPGTAGTPDVNVKLWNALTTVELPLVPTTAGRKLDVSAGGEAGLDWANIGGPTTTVNLSGTTIKTATDIATAVDDLPTNAELATALGTADDAVLAQIALVKAKTDNLPADPADASDLAALLAAIPGAVWDEDITLHTDPDSTGEALAAAAAGGGSPPPTATEIADAVLTRQFDDVTPGAGTRDLLNSGRFIRNGFSISGATLTVLQEDDSTPAYTRTLTTDAAAIPIVGVD